MLSESELRSGLTAPSQLIDADGVARAAVAAVARTAPGPTDDIELLFIERATKESDPWSGQMAFPGGRVDPDDADSNATAERETREELAFDISGAERIGRLDDLEGGRATNRRIIVSAHVYWVGDADPKLTPNYEVADTIWVPASVLLDPASYEDFEFHRAPGSSFPSVRVGPGGKVVWGLTFRLVEDLFDRMGRPFPGVPEL